jgi:hypothetical protein
MRGFRRRQQQDDMLTAAELARFAYCPEQWRLQHGLGLQRFTRGWPASHTSPTRQF